jgi:hypothetical protein
VIGVDALEKGLQLRKNNVVAATDLCLCSINLDILLKSVGMKVGTHSSVSPTEFITKFWKTSGLWSHALSSAPNIEPLFQFLGPKKGKLDFSFLDKKMLNSGEGESDVISYQSLVVVYVVALIFFSQHFSVPSLPSCRQRLRWCFHSLQIVFKQ